MKKASFLLVSLLVLIGISIVKAQNFSVDSTGIVTGSVEVGQTGDFQIDISNTSITGDLLLSWTAIYNTFLPNTPFPGEWEYTICDKGQCYTGIPAGTINMDTTHSGEKAFFKLAMTPHVNGSGI